MPKKSHMFAHLFQHFCAHKADMLIHLAQYQQLSSPLTLTPLAASLGALECLYWQALGCGEVLLAKKIARTVNKAPTRSLAAQGYPCLALVRRSVSVSK